MSRVVSMSVVPVVSMWEQSLDARMAFDQCEELTDLRRFDLDVAHLVDHQAVRQITLEDLTVAAIGQRSNNAVEKPLGALAIHF